MDPQYSAWNLAIGKHFFGPEHAQQAVFLTVDEDTLWRIGQQYGKPLLSDGPQGAVKNFADSVRREIYQRGWIAGYPQADCHPCFLGLLAAQVLAAFRIRHDDAWRETAYWARLCELLHDSAAPYMPLELTGDQHQEVMAQQFRTLG